MIATSDRPSFSYLQTVTPDASHPIVSMDQPGYVPTAPGGRNLHRRPASRRLRNSVDER